VGWALLIGFMVVGSIVVSVLVMREDDKSKAELLQRQHQDQWERQRSMRQRLSPDFAEILRRAETAVETILASTARAEDLLDPPVDENLLREHVQAILAVGQRVADLQAAQGSIETMVLSKSVRPRLTRGAVEGRRSEKDSDVPLGPMTAEILKPQQQALKRVSEAAQKRMLNLEHYASAVSEVDAAYWDFIGAQEAARLNEQVLDLLANTVRDELAVEELTRLTERASVAERTFRYSVREAGLAAENLLLLDGEGS